MIRHGGLNQRPTRQFRPAAAANDLSDQAEHILIGAEPLPKKQGVDAQHTNQGDIAEIQHLERYNAFWDWCSEHFKETIFVPGNHNWYGCWISIMR